MCAGNKADLVATLQSLPPLDPQASPSSGSPPWGGEENNALSAAVAGKKRQASPDKPAIYLSLVAPNSQKCILVAQKIFLPGCP